MPYVAQHHRNRLDAGSPPDSSGELNYKLTVLCIEYFRSCGANYQAINDVVGALESAKAEFQRRIVAPYEDRKIEENGDVYE